MISLHGFPDELAGPVARLGALLDQAPSPISVHRFPDGETLPAVADVASHAVVYRSLHNPDGKLIEVLLAADALRRAGAKRVTLVAPYLPYLRQDTVFRAGEPLSRDVIIPMLSGAFETIVTVDPHLHRTASLGDIASSTHWVVLSGAGAIADAMRDEAPFDAIVGPDAESLRWVAGVAKRLGAAFWTFTKRRGEDRSVSLSAPAGIAVARARLLIVDDVCTSGGTLAAAARILRDLGARDVEAAVTHALFDDAAAAVMASAGLARVRSCDGCLHATNAIALAPLLAKALRAEIAT